jgi:C4-dicarboxylate-specific signal transduction histidine kinase
MADMRQSGGDVYRSLIQHTPVPLWSVDVRRANEVFDFLRAEGVTDIADHLDAHPELVEVAKDTVLVTEANRAAGSLFRAGGSAELVQPVRYLFDATPGLARSVTIAHFEGRRNYSERARIATFDGQMRDVQFSVTFPSAPDSLDTTLIAVEDITECVRAEALLRRLEDDLAHGAGFATFAELATAIAHELRQPLTAIVTNAETSLRWLARGEPDLAKVGLLTGRIIASAHRANDIIGRIQHSRNIGHDDE